MSNSRKLNINDRTSLFTFVMACVLQVFIKPLISLRKVQEALRLSV